MTPTKELKIHIPTLMCATLVAYAAFAPALADSPSPPTTSQSPALSAVMLEHLTWVDVRDLLARGTTTVIIPTGGTEQNGRHMALGKHNFIIANTAQQIARKLGNTLVAPVMAYVPEGDPDKKTGHMKFPGTISLTPKVFEQVLEQAARSLKTHGFKTIVLLGDSGGNQAPQQRVAQRLSRQWNSEGVRVIHASAYYDDNGGDAVLKAKGETKRTIGTHAGIRDTSELMAVYPSGVDLTKAIADQDGATGDPTRATAALGKVLLSRKVDAALNQIRKAMHPSHDAANTSKPQKPSVLSRIFTAIFG